MIYFQAETLLPEVERFVAGIDKHEPETVLATVLFTDIVNSTRRSPSSATPVSGAISSSATTRSCGSSSPASGAKRSTPPATDSSPGSTDQSAPSAARRRMQLRTVVALGDRFGDDRRVLADTHEQG